MYSANYSLVEDVIKELKSSRVSEVEVCVNGALVNLQIAAQSSIQSHGFFVACAPRCHGLHVAGVQLLSLRYSSCVAGGWVGGGVKIYVFK